MRVILVGALMLAAAVRAEPAFVQASQLNVRDKPSAKGALLYVAKLGERCEVLGPDAAAGWSKVTCAGFTGVTKTEFLGKDAPTLEAVSAQFTEAWKKAKTFTAGDDAAAAYTSQGKLYDAAMSLAQRFAELGGQPQTLRDFLSDYYLFQAGAPSGGTTIALTIDPNCPDITGCQHVALLHTFPGVEAASFSSRERYATIHALKDGSFWLRSGTFTGDAEFTATVDQHMTLTSAMAKALDSSVGPDQCPQTADHGLLCSAPTTCEAPTRQCHSCKVSCATTCNTCRIGCRPTRYDACAGACTTTYKACVEVCSKALQDTAGCVEKR
jgi:hypothetical protein